MKRRDEPLTIDAAVVAETLEEHGYERMAALVRDLGQRARQNNVRESQLIAKNDELRRRLLKYEPAEKPRDPVWTGD